MSQMADTLIRVLAAREEEGGASDAPLPWTALSRGAAKVLPPRGSCSEPDDVIPLIRPSNGPAHTVACRLYRLHTPEGYCDGGRARG